MILLKKENIMKKLFVGIFCASIMQIATAQEYQARYPISGVFKSSQTTPETPVTPETPEPPKAQNLSCKTILAGAPTSTNGVYTIKNNGSDLSVYCDMANGGWTLVGVGIRNQTTGWSSTGDLNLTNSPSPNTTTPYRLGDTRINAIGKTVYKTITTGRYANTRYFNGGCVYSQTTDAAGSCLASYSNESLSAGLKQGNSYPQVSGLSDYNSSSTALYVVTGYYGSLSIHGWGMGNGVTAGYSGTGSAGDGGNIQIWIK